MLEDNKRQLVKIINALRFLMQQGLNPSDDNATLTATQCTHKIIAYQRPTTCTSLSSPGSSALNALVSTCCALN